MKKLFSIILFAISGFVAINAQTNFGVKTSFGLIPHRAESVYASDASDYVTHQITFNNASPVISGGVYLKKVMGWTYFQMDAMYSSYSLDYKLDQFGTRSINNKIVTEKFKNIDLVINAGITSDNLRLGFGPVFHILADHESAFDEVPNYNERLSGMTYGFTGAVGYDLGNLSVDVRYENALTTIGDHIFFGSARSKFTTGANQITLSVGYGF